VEYLSTLTLRCQLEVANVFSDEDNKMVKHPHIFGGQFKSTPPDNVKVPSVKVDMRRVTVCFSLD